MTTPYHTLRKFFKDHPAWTALVDRLVELETVAPSTPPLKLCTPEDITLVWDLPEGRQLHLTLPEHDMVDLVIYDEATVDDEGDEAREVFDDSLVGSPFTDYIAAQINYAVRFGSLPPL